MSLIKPARWALSSALIDPKLAFMHRTSYVFPFWENDFNHYGRQFNAPTLKTDPFFQTAALGTGLGGDSNTSTQYDVSIIPITAPFTIAFFFNTLAASGTFRWLAGSTGSNTQGFRFILSPSGGSVIRFRSVAAGGVNNDAPFTWAAGDDLMVIGRYDGALTYLDVFNLSDGSSGSNTEAETGSFTHEDPWTFGTSGDVTDADMFAGTHYWTFLDGESFWTDAQIDLIVRDPFGPISMYDDYAAWRSVAAAGTILPKIGPGGFVGENSFVIGGGGLVA